MFLPHQFDGVVMDSLARGNEERLVAVHGDFLGMGHRESQAFEVVACV